MPHTTTTRKPNSGLLCNLDFSNKCRNQIRASNDRAYAIVGDLIFLFLTQYLTLGKTGQTQKIQLHTTTLLTMLNGGANGDLRFSTVNIQVELRVTVKVCTFLAEILPVQNYQVKNPITNSLPVKPLCIPTLIIHTRAVTSYLRRYNTLSYVDTYHCMFSMYRNL